MKELRVCSEFARVLTHKDANQIDVHLDSHLQANWNCILKHLKHCMHSVAWMEQRLMIS